VIDNQFPSLQLATTPGARLAMLESHFAVRGILRAGGAHPAGGESMTMVGDWVLRWDTRREAVPRVVHLHEGARSAVEVFTAPSGDVVVLDGYVFGAGSGAAEHVATLYARSGEAALDELRGGYAVAIWDAQRRRLLAARDATGISSTFYVWKDGVFLFAPTVDPILSQPEVDGSPDRVVVAEFLLDVLPLQQAHDSFFADVHRLPPGYRIALAGGELSLARYWDPVPPGFEWASDAECAQFDAFLERAVGRCLEVGADSIALSGGFDSVGIAVVAAGQRRGAAPLHALSVRFPIPECDESETQIAVARRLGMPQTIQNVADAFDEGTLVEHSLRASAVVPNPVLSAWEAAFSLLFRGARARGLRSVLMGTGGDEVLSVDVGQVTDALTSFDVRGLWRFYDACRRTFSLSPWVIARLVFWEAGLRRQLQRLARDAALAVAPSAVEWLLRRRRLRAPAWFSYADSDLVAALERRRRENPPVPLAPGEGAYVSAIRRQLVAPLVLIGQDLGHAWAGSLGSRLLYPFYDRDLVGLLLRMHPDRLIAGGRFKAPLRRLVNERLGDFRLPPRKVDFTGMLHRVLRDGGQKVWQSLRADLRLVELGIVDGARLDPLMNDYFHARNDSWLPVWLLLSTEAWLRARAPRPRVRKRV
jgi:asparagine synthetase B (glutamine-hydrolysing)